MRLSVYPIALPEDRSRSSARFGSSASVKAREHVRQVVVLVQDVVKRPADVRRIRIQIKDAIRRVVDDRHGSVTPDRNHAITQAVDDVSVERFSVDHLRALCIESPAGMDAIDDSRGHRRGVRERLTFDRQPAGCLGVLLCVATTHHHMTIM